jgi:hypothetical protein
MGNSNSQLSPDDLARYSSSKNDTYTDKLPQCIGFGNDHIAYITKQYLTMYSADLQLQQVTDNLLKNLDEKNPERYLIDTSFVLADLSPLSFPLQTTIDIFNPSQKIVGVKNGYPIYRYYTVLDQYNDFFLIEFKSLPTDSERSSRAQQIRGELAKRMHNCIVVLLGSCNDIGRPPLTQDSQQKLPQPVQQAPQVQQQGQVQQPVQVQQQGDWFSNPIYQPSSE